MKNKLFIVVLFSFLFLPSVFCMAVDNSNAPGYWGGVDTQLNAVSGENGAGVQDANDPRVVAGYVIQIIMGFTALIFVAYTVYGGYTILTSAGNEERISKGKSILRFSVIGILILLGAYGITTLVVRIIQGQGTPTGSGIWIGDPVRTNPDPLEGDYDFNYWTGN